MQEIQHNRGGHDESISRAEALCGAGLDVAVESPFPEPARTAPPSEPGAEGPRPDRGAPPLPGSSPGAPAAPTPLAPGQGESARAFEAYRVYLELGPRRRYAAVARQV